MKKILFIALICIVTSCSSGEAPSARQDQNSLSHTASQVAVNDDLRKQAQAFIDVYTIEYLQHFYKLQIADWNSQTNINDENDKKKIEADTTLSLFVGNPETIKKITYYLEKKDQLSDLQIRQLRYMKRKAAARPGTLPATVSQLIQSETKQISDLYGFNFRVSERGQEKVVTANDIQTVLETAKDLKQRQLYWEASKEVGVVLKEGLDKLRGLRNEVARHMGYSSFFALGVDEYDFTSDEMIAMMDKLLEEIKPLYRELHTYARYELAKRYNLPVPDYLPAHWLGNRWGQNWPGLVEGIDYNQGFKDKTSEWMIKTAEKYYMSQGFPALSENFWKNSDLYELPADAKRKKNTHASAWHLNLDDDYRSLMSIKPDYDWFTTIHHELGHIYYYITYAVPSVPPLLRDSPTSGFHEAITTFNQLAVSQRSYLTSYGITEAKADSPDDDIRALLAQAFEFVVFLPFGAGTMPHFEYALYENNLDPSQFNKAWWDYVKKYQGVVPPTERDEHYCDAASKTHINDYPVMYFNYAFAQVLAYQLNDHIAKNILKKDPHNVNYFGQKEAGDFLRKMMVQGNTKGWRELLKETVGSELSAKPMLEYYAPLMTYLKEQNKGRVYSEF